jgi:hypothetical protein
MNFISAAPEMPTVATTKVEASRQTFQDFIAFLPWPAALFSGPVRCGANLTRFFLVAHARRAALELQAIRAVRWGRPGGPEKRDHD